MDRQAIIEEALTFIKPTREAILDVLADGKIHTMVKLASLLKLTDSSVRKACQKMEADGLIVTGDVRSNLRRAKGVRKA